MVKVKRIRNNSRVKVVILHGRPIALIRPKELGSGYIVESLFGLEEREYPTYSEARAAAIEAPAMWGQHAGA